jgi:hypothetical protein
MFGFTARNYGQSLGLSTAGLVWLGGGSALSTNPINRQNICIKSMHFLLHQRGSQILDYLLSTHVSRRLCINQCYGIETEINSFSFPSLPFPSPLPDAQQHDFHHGILHPESSLKTHHPFHPRAYVSPVKHCRKASSNHSRPTFRPPIFFTSGLYREPHSASARSLPLEADEISEWLDILHYWMLGAAVALVGYVNEKA